MIADYNGLPADTYATLPREERLRYIAKSLSTIALEVKTLQEIIDAELESDRDEVNVATIRLLGKQAMQVTQATSEIGSTIETPAIQEVVELQEPEVDINLVIVQPEIEPAKAAAALPGEQTNPYRKEKYPIPLNNRYYARLFPAEELPPINFDENMETLEIVITGENMITLNGREIYLTGDELYLYNLLMRHRDQDQIKTSQFFDHGFRMKPSRSTSVALSNIMVRLRSKLVADTDSGQVELISKHGNTSGTTYSVTPATIRHGVVREGSEVTVEFTDKEGGNATFRVQNIHKEPDPESKTRTLSREMPMVAGAWHKKPGDTFTFTLPSGDVEARIVAIS